MSSILDRIAKVDIALDSPITNDVGFDNILILGNSPKTLKADTEIPVVGVYQSLGEITELGYVATGEGADPVGVAARIAFSQSPKPSKIYLAVVPSPDDVTTPAADGDPAETMSAVDVLNYALGTNGWYCICPVGLTADAVKEVIEWTETQEKICGYIDNDPDNPLVDTGLFMRSYAVFGKESEKQEEADIPLENKYAMAVAMACKALYYHAGEETWAMRSVSGVYPASLSSTFIGKLTNANISYVTKAAGKNITLGGKTNGGEWIDIIRFRDWLQNDMQTRLVNLLLTNPKIPYTDAGISLVQNQMIASLKSGQQYGGIAPTEYDEDGGEIPGYTTSVPTAASLTAVQKKSRVLTDCNFTARLAGAIHIVEVKGTLTYENI